MAMHMALLYADHITRSRQDAIARDVRRTRGGRQWPRRSGRNPDSLRRD